MLEMNAVNAPRPVPRWRSYDREVTTYVLIHGNWHDGSAWRGVAAALTARGHRSIAPTLPGRGEDPSKQTTYAACAQSVVDLITDEGLRDVVVVGHSGGAVVGSKVAQAIPDRIRWMTFVSGVVLEDGECLLDAAPPQYRPTFDRLAAESSDYTVTIPFELWRSSFINDADLDLACTTYQQLCPEGYDLLTEHVDRTGFADVDIPMSYVNLVDDVVFPPGEWGWHPRLTSRLPFRRILRRPGSHEVMFTNPEALAEAIVEASEAP